MSFIAWFYKQIKKLDQSLDEFYAEIRVIYYPDGTVEYVSRDQCVDNITDEPEDEQNISK